MKLEAGKKYAYYGQAPFVLSNGRKIIPGEEIEVNKDLVSSSESFSEVITYDLDAIHGEALNENHIFDKKKEEAARKAAKDGTK